LAIVAGMKKRRTDKSQTLKKEKKSSYLCDYLPGVYASAPI